MAESPKTIGDLYKAKAITEESLNAAADAYLYGSHADRVDLGNGYAVDVAAAVQAHRYVRDVLANRETPAGFRKTMVKTAILLAKVETKGGQDG